MSAEKKQFVLFKSVVLVLYRLCMEHRSGILYIYTDEAYGATFSLANGIIIKIDYRTLSGMPALDMMKTISNAKFVFKTDLSMRDRTVSDSEYLPANNVILKKLGLIVSDSLSWMGEEIKKILVVDDSALSRKVITQVFSGESYDLTEAEDGLDAMEKLSQQTPDLVLLDLILPKMDGYEVLSAMKQDDKYKNIPVIMLTSRGALMDKLKGKMSATDEYLTKPVDKDELMSKVRKYLR